MNSYLYVPEKREQNLYFDIFQNCNVERTPLDTIAFTIGSWSAPSVQYVKLYSLLDEHFNKQQLFRSIFRNSNNNKRMLSVWFWFWLLVRI